MKFALLSFEYGKVIIFDLRDQSVRWRYNCQEDVLGAYWYQYPNKVVVVTAIGARVINIYWRYQTEGGGKISTDV